MPSAWFEPPIDTGSRLLVSSLLPVTRDSLVYGSNDAGRTVHRSPEAAEIMQRMARRLNLKEHLVGQGDRPVPLYGPCDIEVHR